MKTVKTLLLSVDEYKILNKLKRKLMIHLGVKIHIPEVPKNDSSSDTIVAIISGEPNNVAYAQVFLEEGMREHTRKRQAKCSKVKDVPVITLEDSDSDNPVLANTQNKKRKVISNQKKKQVKYCHSFNHTSVNGKNEKVCQVSSAVFIPVCRTESSSSEVEHQHVEDIPENIANKSTPKELDDSILILSENINSSTTDEIIPNNLISNSSSIVTNDSIIVLSEDIDLPSIASTSKTCFTTNSEKSANDIISVSSMHANLPPAANFIPLRTVARGKKKVRKFNEKNILALSQDEIPRPLEKCKRVLRPIVIDGSNVAREHGKSRNIFSCKGIKLSVEYFLKRGHTQVTAFLPQYRRHCKYGPILTTDQEVLIELEQSENIAFTPSRKVNGTWITCYDDRFIVQLACMTGGVILSNDNYRDIAEESAEFKKTIDERLLMYCFVGDILMIPDDPLGRYGPKLDTFLSMKETITNEIPSNSLQVMIMDQDSQCTKADIS